jgi:hypothetical protein
MGAASPDGNRGIQRTAGGYALGRQNELLPQKKNTALSNLLEFDTLFTKKRMYATNSNFPPLFMLPFVGAFSNAIGLVSNAKRYDCEQ